MIDLAQDRKLELWKEAYLAALKTPRYHNQGPANLESLEASSERSKDRHFFCQEIADEFLKEYELVYRQLKREE